MTSAARYKVICEYQQAISDDGDDIFVEETEVRRLFADPDFLGLFYDWEQRAIKQKSGIFVKKDRSLVDRFVFAPRLGDPSTVDAASASSAAIPWFSGCRTE